MCFCMRAQSRLTLSDCSPPNSFVHGICPARTLEWVTIYYSRGSSWPRDQTSISCVSCIACTSRQIFFFFLPPSYIKNVHTLIKKHFIAKNANHLNLQWVIIVMIQIRVLAFPQTVEIDRRPDKEFKSESVSCSVVSDSLWLHGLMLPTSLLCPWGFSRQEYWSGLPCPPPGDLPNPGIELRSLALQADSLPSEPIREAQEIEARLYWSPCCSRGESKETTGSRVCSMRWGNFIPYRGWGQGCVQGSGCRTDLGSLPNPLVVFCAEGMCSTLLWLLTSCFLLRLFRSGSW